MKTLNFSFLDGGKTLSRVPTARKSKRSLQNLVPGISCMLDLTEVRMWDPVVYVVFRYSCKDLSWGDAGSCRACTNFIRSFSSDCARLLKAAYIGLIRQCLCGRCSFRRCSIPHTAEVSREAREIYSEGSGCLHDGLRIRIGLPGCLVHLFLFRMLASCGLRAGVFLPSDLSSYSLPSYTHYAW